MALGDVYRLTRKVRLNGQDHVNVLHFHDTDYGAADPELALMDVWDPGSVPVVNPESTLKTVQRGFTSAQNILLSCQRVLPTAGLPVERGINSAFLSAVGDGLPSFAQVKYLIQGQGTGRPSRGGFYVGAIPDGWTTGNAINTSYTAQADGFVSAFLDAFTATGGQFIGFTAGVLSRLLLQFFAIQQFGYATTMGTMYSRRAGIGT